MIHPSLWSERRMRSARSSIPTVVALCCTAMMSVSICSCIAVSGERSS